ncbi:hypothetical protein [Mycobacterium sp. DL440]|uniref:hypothetical protein n=1 Tax=Mycobacterium sp. DL440 TaxID=2675523 RepID=UPI001422DD2A|nr:hypothetical protein [Mycobacterium sp. DL440]
MVGDRSGDGRRDRGGDVADHAVVAGTLGDGARSIVDVPDAPVLDVPHVVDVIADAQPALEAPAKLAAEPEDSPVSKKKVAGRTAVKAAKPAGGESEGGED